ncbi:MAG: energy-coupling factor transporter ATPase [Chloroflexi bacterium]|nr:energy-coupling factor transporter ATPase [Chloroflexota bacterium]
MPASPNLPTVADRPARHANGHDASGEIDAGQAPAAPLVVEVRDLWYRYLAGTPLETAALQGVTFDLRATEIAAIVGHTGSGKSTLVQHLNGLLRPQQGSVQVVGFDLGDRKLDIRQVRRQVGLVMQLPEQQLFEPTVGDDVAFGPRRFGYDRDEVRRRVRAAMEIVGLSFEQFKDRYTFGLSGGEMRRVAIAGVLALEPAVLVLDEPTAGLDPRGRREMLATVTRLRERGLQERRGMAVLLVSHNMEEVAEIAERVWVMADGAVALSGMVREVFRSATRLDTLRLGVPQVTRLMQRLRERGLSVPTDVYTVDDAEQVLWTILGS